MEIKSSSFQKGEFIPKKFTCDDEDISPALSWSAVPEKTKSFALICDDPDAPMGNWVHWVIYNLPANCRELQEHIPLKETLENGSKQGRNDFGDIGYGGPCPPGGTHRYIFKLYALSKILELKSGAKKSQLVKAMEGCILAEAQIMGMYRRS